MPLAAVRPQAYRSMRALARAKNPAPAGSAKAIVSVTGLVMSRTVSWPVSIQWLSSR
jgi:hypothetical protein